MRQSSASATLKQEIADPVFAAQCCDPPPGGYDPWGVSL